MTNNKRTSMRVFEIACVSCVAAFSLWLVWGGIQHDVHHEWQLIDLIQQGATQDTLSLLKAEPALINSRLPYGSDGWQMPINVAAQYGNDEAAAWLLQNGANANALDVSQFTPIKRVVNFWSKNTTELSRVCFYVGQRGW